MNVAYVDGNGVIFTRFLISTFLGALARLQVEVLVELLVVVARIPREEEGGDGPPSVFSPPFP